MDEDKLSLLEKEMIEFDYQDSWNHIFQRLKNEASLCCREATVNVARSANNRSRNRYRDISPFDHSRVRLDKGENDYINASLIEMKSVNRRYILTQGPLPTTCGHFWQMVFEANTKAIVMLNRIVEKGVLKCHPYFPMGAHRPGGVDSLFLPDVRLKVTLRAEQDFGYYMRREFEVEEEESGVCKSVTQWHYLTWPDFGVPRSPGSFLNFLMAVRRSGGLDLEVGPPVVHCSAGVGRSGTFALVDTALKMIVESDGLEDIDLRAILLEMRRYRLGLIYTPDQLRFSYLSVIEGGRGLLEAKKEPDTNLDEVQFPVDDADLLPPAESTDDLSTSSDPDEEIIISGVDRLGDLEEMYRAAGIDDEGGQGSRDSPSISPCSFDGTEEVCVPEREPLAAAGRRVHFEPEEEDMSPEPMTHDSDDENRLINNSVRQRYSNNNQTTTSPHLSDPSEKDEDTSKDADPDDSAAILRAGHLSREERQRRRADRMARTQAIISEMKRKMSENDMKRQRWASFQRLVLPAGIVLAISVGGYFIYRVLLGGQGA